MEAMIDVLREKAMEITFSKKEEYNMTRIDLLGTSEYRILRTGRLEMTNRKVPFLNYLAFILRCLAEESGGSIDGHISLEGWRKLGESVKVRDRLTHPKKDTIMDVSDKEAAACNDALLWLWKTTVELFENEAWSNYKVVGGNIPE